MSDTQKVTVPIKLTYDKLDDITRIHLIPYWTILDLLDKNNASYSSQITGLDFKGYIHEGVRAYQSNVTNDYASLISNRMSVDGSFIDTRVWRDTPFYKDITAIMLNYTDAIQLLRRTHTFYKKACILHKKILLKTVEPGIPDILFDLDPQETDGINVWIPRDMIIDRTSSGNTWSNMALNSNANRMDEQFFKDHLPDILTNYQQFMGKYRNFYSNNIKPYKLLALIN